jgi:hypothetical protein
MDFSNTMGLPVNFQLTELSGSYSARYHSLYCISYIHEVLTYSEAPLKLMVKVLSHLTTRIRNTPSIRTESTKENPNKCLYSVGLGATSKPRRVPSYRACRDLIYNNGCTMQFF